MTDKGHLVSPDSVFDDGKAPDALRTIGEVARLVGVKPHVLRYWEEQFPMLRPLTRAGNRRYYRAEDVALVATIDRLLNREGYTIRGARQALEGGLCPSMPTSTLALRLRLPRLRLRLRLRRHQHPSLLSINRLPRASRRWKRNWWPLLPACASIWNRSAAAWPRRWTRGEMLRKHCLARKRGLADALATCCLRPCFRRRTGRLRCASDRSVQFVSCCW
jgi:DNA-binding transcriptional MerR regulator